MEPHDHRRGARRRPALSQVAFTGAAILVAAGAVVLALSLRERDTATINPDEAVVVPAA
jgi:hypothetical protein